ncbi:MAG TPA: hypothetical protein VFV92_13945 [Candidatus Bathyarchaeia archaeon]|nr:hypothetical protein [Candidatus Bathyarchaeia archaeon]
MSDSMQSSDWKGFMRKHWGLGVIFGIAAVLVLIGAVYVFWWFIGEAQSSGLVPSSLGLWTMSNLITFVLHAIFWELLIIGIPVAIAAIVGWQWWMRLPADERRGFRMGRHGKRSGGGGGGGLLLFIAFCIKVYLDGNWHVPIGTFTLNYVVSSMILILILAGVIFGIPATIAAVWWVRREMRSS